VTTPRSWSEIPGVPAGAFKEAELTTGAAARAALVFETSGTTRGDSGRHYMETPALYDAALLAGFDRFVLRDGLRLRYLNLVPNPAESPHSSLGYMMARVAKMRGDERTGWYLSGEELRLDAFLADVQDAVAAARPVCIAATAFAFVHCFDAMDADGRSFALPKGSRAVYTGGFKGRSRSVGAEQLRAAICERFGLPATAVFVEYGMTELTSQYYAGGGALEYAGPPWLRARVVGPDRKTLASDETGALVHVDLANRSSCVAIQTEDLGLQTARGLVVLGREIDAPARGCSLAAEDVKIKR
jgi:Acyl-protein synthetase, LuxE